MKSFLATTFLLLPLAYSAVVPSIAPRDEISKDTIRYMKCAKLVNDKKHADNGASWERGMVAYYPDKSSAGAPTGQVFFDMYTAKDDVFYNNHGRVYGGDIFFWGGGKIWSDFVKPYTENNKPPRGVYVGHAKRTAEKEFGFNCFTEGSDKPFKYEDQYYGTCTAYVSCVQADALQVNVPQMDNPLPPQQPSNTLHRSKSSLPKRRCRRVTSFSPNPPKSTPNSKKPTTPNKACATQKPSLSPRPPVSGRPALSPSTVAATMTAFPRSSSYRTRSQTSQKNPRTRNPAVR